MSFFIRLRVFERVFEKKHVASKKNLNKKHEGEIQLTKNYVFLSEFSRKNM